MEPKNQAVLTVTVEIYPPDVDCELSQRAIIGKIICVYLIHMFLPSRTKIIRLRAAKSMTLIYKESHRGRADLRGRSKRDIPYVVAPISAMRNEEASVPAQKSYTAVKDGVLSLDLSWTRRD